MISGLLAAAIAQVIAEPAIPFRIEELPDSGFVFIVDKYFKSQEDLIDRAFKQASQTRCLPRQVYAGSFTSRTKPTADGKDEVVTNLRHLFYCSNPTVLQMSIAPKGWHPDDGDDRRVRELAQKFLQTAATSNFDAVMAMKDPNSSEPEAVSRENYRRTAQITGRLEKIEIDDVQWMLDAREESYEGIFVVVVYHATYEKALVSCGALTFFRPDPDRYFVIRSDMMALPRNVSPHLYDESAKQCRR